MDFTAIQEAIVDFFAQVVDFFDAITKYFEDIAGILSGETETTTVE